MFICTLSIHDQCFFFFSSRRRHTRWNWDWSSDVCSSDLWGWHRGGFRQSQSQEIAHGTAQTGVDGTFKIEFTARPDLAVAEKDEPTFMFEINADVTDSAGETQSAQRAI